MKVEVQCINERGRALYAAERRSLAPKHSGMLVLRPERRDILGRDSLVAHLHGTRNGQLRDVVPELLEAKVVWVRLNHIRMRGFEVVDDIEYAQCWDIKVLPC